MTFVPMELGDHISQGVLHQLSVTPVNKRMTLDNSMVISTQGRYGQTWSNGAWLKWEYTMFTVYHRSSWLKAVAFFRTVPSPPTPHRKLSLWPAN